MTVIDLLDPAIQADPYEAYKVLRDEAPVYPMPGTDYVVVSRYEDVAEIIRCPHLFSASANGTGADTMIKSPRARAIYAARGCPRTTPFTADAPLHGLYREIVDRSFSASRVRKLEWRVREVIEGLVDNLSDDADFVNDFCVPLPMTIITERMGLPLADMPQLKAWSEMWAAPYSHALSEDQEIAVAEAGVAMQRYFLDWAERKRSEPAEDIITDLVTARVGGERALTDTEFVGIAETLLTGGNETTANAIAMAMKLMIETPGLEDALRTDPARIRTFVEEALRLESPTQGLWRFALRDTELAGVRIAAGTPVHIRFAAANRDERHFPDPGIANLDRRNAGSHMAFNQGPHHCSGAPLARQEMQLSFEILLRRRRNFRLAEPKAASRYQPGLVIRALSELRLRSDPIA